MHGLGYAQHLLMLDKLIEQGLRTLLQAVHSEQRHLYLDVDGHMGGGHVDQFLTSHAAVGEVEKQVDLDRRFMSARRELRRGRLYFVAQCREFLVGILGIRLVDYFHLRAYRSLGQKYACAFAGDFEFGGAAHYGGARIVGELYHLEHVADYAVMEQRVERRVVLRRVELAYDTDGYIALFRQFGNVERGLAAKFYGDCDIWEKHDIARRKNRDICRVDIEFLAFCLSQFYMSD